VALAVVGIYGVISYGVGQRRKEFGIRSALGASANALRWVVLSEGLRLAAAGVGVGLLLAAPLSYAMREQLFGVSALSPTLYLAAGMLLLTVAAAACGIPALTATRVDPAMTLRQD
jgi:ABC-type antimicrobial peptide transport system permease subunit